MVVPIIRIVCTTGSPNLKIASLLARIDLYHEVGSSHNTFDLTKTYYEVILQKAIPAQIRQHVLCYEFLI